MCIRAYTSACVCVCVQIGVSAHVHMYECACGIRVCQTDVETKRRTEGKETKGETVEVRPRDCH